VSAKIREARWLETGKAGTCPQCGSVSKSNTRSLTRKCPVHDVVVSIIYQCTQHNFNYVTMSEIDYPDHYNGDCSTCAGTGKEEKINVKVICGFWDEHQ